ncbi:MAG: hypothetical protein NW207_06850 [Cytophagales bacterium]|nr:hypothetical protein [Cytophagales bacterium]
MWSALKQEVLDYINTKIELVKLDFVEKGISILEILLKAIFLILLFSLIILFLALTLAFAMSKYLGSYILGFASISVICLVIFVILYFTQSYKALAKSILKYIIK